MTAEQADRLWELCREDIWEFRAWLAAHSDLRLYEVFAFTLDDAVRLYGDPTDRDALRQLLDRLCIGFRELAEHNPEHFILTNPVHARPFIRLGPDQYFTGVHGVIPHIALNVLEGLLADDERAYARGTAPGELNIWSARSRASSEAAFQAQACWQTYAGRPSRRASSAGSCNRLTRRSCSRTTVVPA